MLKRMTIIALQNVKPEYREALQKFMDTQKNPMTMYAPIRSTAIIHGNFRGDNLLHRVREDGKVDIKIVDLQCLQTGSPVCDLLFFIFCDTDEEFRAKYYMKLLDHYYTHLSAAMKRLNLNPEETFPREDFGYEMNEKLPFGLTTAVFCLPMLTIDSEDAPEVNESLDFGSFKVDKPSDMYAERLNGVVNDFVKWGVLK